MDRSFKRLLFILAVLSVLTSVYLGFVINIILGG